VGLAAVSRKGRRLIDHCAASDGLAADARRLVTAGFEVSGPDEGGRRLPDATEIRWRIARVRQEGRVMPFLIEDLTPRSLRVPGGKETEHPIGARDIIRLLLAVEDADRPCFACRVGGRREARRRAGGHATVRVPRAHARRVRR
jgi:hypothetical protein